MNRTNVHTIDDALLSVGLDPDHTPVDVAMRHLLWALADFFEHENDPDGYPDQH
jgi:Arc/MetJ family transcription regulator